MANRKSIKSIETLIRLRKRELDELRRQMVPLENQKEQLKQLIIRLQNDLDSELVLAGQQAEMAGFFGDFAKRIRKRQEDVRDEIKALEKKITKLSDQISEAFGEVKKFEIVRDNAKHKQKLAEEHSDMLRLDEIAIQQHRRKDENA